MNMLDTGIYWEEKKSRQLSAIITLLIMLGIYAFLVLYVMYYQNPPIQEGGVEVSLGIADAGMNGEFMELPEYNNAPPPASRVEEADNLTQDTEDAPQISTENTAEKTSPQTEPNNSTQPANPEAAPVKRFDMSNRQNTSGGIGSGGKPGNQGDPNGSPDGDPYGTGSGSGGTGTGSGSGSGISSGKRKTSYVYKGQTNCRQSGIVMVEFTVNRAGKVVSAKAVMRNSSITDPVCQREAEQNAKKWSFEPDANAPELEKGVLPVHFKIE
jgi:TonB family protein